MTPMMTVIIFRAKVNEAVYSSWPGAYALDRPPAAAKPVGMRSQMPVSMTVKAVPPNLREYKLPRRADDEAADECHVVRLADEIELVLGELRDAKRGA